MSVDKLININTGGGRDAKIDTLKGVLIVLVVVGHYIELNIESFGCNYLHNLIYLFHMPLFVFISGYVSNTKSRRYFISTLSLVEVYILYQVLYSVRHLPIEIHFDVPFLQLWYLPALFIWRVADYLTRKYDALIILVCSFAVAIISGFIETISYFVLSRTAVFSFFYFLGRLCREREGMKKLHRLSPNYGYTFIVLTLILLLFVKDLGRVVYCSQPYSVLSSNVFIGCLIRIAFMVYSTLLCASIVLCSKAFGFICEIGRNTLPIYIYHAALIFILPRLNTYLNFPLNIVTLVLTAFSFVYIIVLLSRYINFSILLHPLTYYIERERNKKKN